MNSTVLRSPCAALVLAFSTLTPALAQTQLPTVDVAASRHTPLRYDVSSACPNVGEQLQESLARSTRYIDQPSEIRVEFDLQAQTLDKVSASGGQWELRNPVRRAVAKLQCANGTEGKQRYAFLLRFQLEDGNGAPMGSSNQAQAVTIQPLYVLARKD